MTEQDLINLGFHQNIVLPEESGDATPFWYYTYDFYKNSSLSLISSDNEEAEKDGWYVEMFEADRVRFTDIKELNMFMSLIERNTKKGDGNK